MIIVCPECQREFSDQAKACVHCGARNPHKMSTIGKLGVFLLILFGIFVTLIIIGNLIYDPEKDAALQAIEECRNAENDELLGIEARRIAGGACDILEQRFKAKYGYAP